MKISNRILHHKLFDALNQGIQKGTLHITTPENESASFVGSKPGAVAHWQIKDWSVIQALASRGDIGLGETYTQGMWESDNLEQLFIVFIDNIDELDRMANGSVFSRFCFRILNHLIRRNSEKGSRQNIRSHYDVGNEFYKLWLDPSMTYSSAIYASNDASLETAQFQKYQRMLDHIDPSRKNILEIGCGWGGFAEQAAQAGHRLTGLTISNAQHQFANQRLGGKADIRLEDYRHTKGTYDAIASIEMFEAVGMRYWPTYFSTIKQRLARDGVAMVQTITIKDEDFSGYIKRSDYIRHYVFPGGMLPSVASFKNSAGKAGLACKEAFLFGQDYARTLREWLVRFDNSLPSIRLLGYNEAFIRSWRLYMSMCIASFACGRTNVMQMELVHA